MRLPATLTTKSLLAVRLAALALALTILTTCDHQVPPTAPELGPPTFAISDAAHSGGNPDFFFLPPLAPDPSDHPQLDSKRFDATQPAEVEICELSGDACGAVIAEYTMETGPGSETVRVSEADQLYIVNWHTGEFELSYTETYRVTVLVAGTPLGYVDVKVYARARAAKKTNTAGDTRSGPAALYPSSSASRMEPSSC